MSDKKVGKGKKGKNDRAKSAPDWLSSFLAEPTNRDEYDLAQASTEFAEQVHFILDHIGITQVQLASRLGMTPPAVSQFLHGEANLQLKTMVQVASALEHEVHVLLRERGQVAGQLFVEPLPAATDWFVHDEPTTSLVAGWPASNNSPVVFFDPGQPITASAEPAGTYAAWLVDTDASTQ